MNIKLRTKIIVTAVIAVALLAGYWAVSRLVVSSPEVFDRVIVELEHAPAEHVLPQLRRVAASVNDSPLLMTRSLRSADPDVLEAADLLLAERLAAWRELPREQASERLSQLVNQLSHDADQLSPVGRQIARRAVHETMSWPTLPGEAQSGPLLVTCQQVLTQLDRYRAADAERPLRVADKQSAGALR